MIPIFKGETKRELLSNAYESAFNYLKYEAEDRTREARKNMDVRLTVSDIMMSNLKGRTSVFHKPKVMPTKERLITDRPYARFPGYPKKIIDDKQKLEWLNKQVNNDVIDMAMYFDFVSVLDKREIKMSDVLTNKFGFR